MLARLISIRALAAALAVSLALPAATFAQEEEEYEDDTSGTSVFTADPNQPAVTSGGRYTIVNFPLAELERTLLLVEGILELRLDLAIDMRRGSTFETWTTNLFARYGVNDTLELQAGLDANVIVPDGAENNFGLFAAVEGSIMYDLMDWRVGVGLPVNPDFRFDIFFGLPIKVRILKERLAILAFEKILTIHTHSVTKPTVDNPDAKSMAKPDLTISVGFLVQVLRQLAVIARAEVQSVGFEGDIVVPLSIDGQYTINNRMDVGVSLRLSDLNRRQAEAGSADLKRVPIDNRAVAFFFRFRI
jgi:hypothetical protein